MMSLRDLCPYKSVLEDDEEGGPILFYLMRQNQGLDMNNADILSPRFKNRENSQNDRFNQSFSHFPSFPSPQFSSSSSERGSTEGSPSSLSISPITTSTSNMQLEETITCAKSMLEIHQRCNQGRILRGNDEERGEHKVIAGTITGRSSNSQYAQSYDNVQVAEISSSNISDQNLSDRKVRNKRSRGGAEVISNNTGRRSNTKRQKVCKESVDQSTLKSDGPAAFVNQSLTTSAVTITTTINNNNHASHRQTRTNRPTGACSQDIVSSSVDCIEKRVIIEGRCRSASKKLKDTLLLETKRKQENKMKKNMPSSHSDKSACY